MNMTGMPANTSGFDACVSLDRYVGGLKWAGVDFVIRYIGSTPAWVGKYITPEEAVSLAIAKVALVLVYETTGRPSGKLIGENDGEYAAQVAPTIGILPNTGAVIEYTEDKDTTAAEIPGIAAAFQAFKDMLPGYDIGSYGGGYCNAQMAARGLIKIKWLTQSQGFNGTQEAIASGDYDVIQRLPANVTINGSMINIDPDSLHVAGADIGARIPWGGKIPLGAPINTTSLQMLLKMAAPAVAPPPLQVDDISGNDTKAALAEFAGKYGFGPADWDSIIPQLIADAGLKIYEPVTA